MSERSFQRVLVTGGGGFLGSRVVRRYLDQGCTVRAIGRRFPTSARGNAARLEFVELDIRDPQKLSAAVAGQDLVVHTAGMTRVAADSQLALQEEINVAGTRNVITACREHGVSRLLHVSTVGTIGPSLEADSPADETSPVCLDDGSPGYQPSKCRAERLVLDATGLGLDAVVVNPGFMFGSLQSEYRGAEVIRRPLRRRLIICTRGGLSVVHVDDVAAGLVRAATFALGGERYILSGDNVSFTDIARTVRRIADRMSVIVTVPDIPGRQWNRYAFYSSSRARTALNYQPRSFEEIVRDYFRWVAS